jgi:hypothetical protein
MNKTKPVNAPLITEYKQMVIDFVINQMKRECTNQAFESNEISNRYGTRNVAEFRGIYFVYE